MLYARSNAEAHLYMDLHPCECGDAVFERSSTLVARGDTLTSVYEGTCRTCGERRTFEFALPDELLPVGPGVGYGGDDPSRIIGPGEFALLSDRLAKRVPASAAGLDATGVERARRDLAIAIAALEEVLKFIPAADDRVPAQAFRSAAGKELYLRDPGRFNRMRLGATIAAYRGILAKMAH